MDTCPGVGSTSPATKPPVGLDSVSESEDSVAALFPELPPVFTATNSPRERKRACCAVEIEARVDFACSSFKLGAMDV